MKTARIAIVLVLLLVAALIWGVESGQAAHGLQATEAPAVIPLYLPTPTPRVVGPRDFPAYINPLTGLPVEDPALLEARPVVVKVTNFPRSVRPQSGLSLADIVYEYYMERSIPRFIAIYHGADIAKIGPVRSGRFFDEHVFRMYDGIFVFGNADPHVMDYFLEQSFHLYNSFILEGDEQIPCQEDDPVPLCRDTEIDSYNNMFTDTAAVRALVAARGGRLQANSLEGMLFQDRAPLSDKFAQNISVQYSLSVYHRWVYSPQDERYLRYQETGPLLDPAAEAYAPLSDALTGEQIATDNVVVLIVPHEYYVKSTDTEIIQIDLLDWGLALVFRDGYAYWAFWERPENYDVLQIITADREPFPLKPGTTWFQVVSSDTTIERELADWHIVFEPPQEPGEGTAAGD
jgi:hypothetical protein